MKLEIGYNHAFEVRRETLQADCKDSFSVLFLSDFHFNRRSEEMANRIAVSINDLSPTLILFGGDYADTRSGLGILDRLFRSIICTGNIFAIGGNHDYALGIDGVKACVTGNGATWMEKSSVQVKIGNTLINISSDVIAKPTEADVSILIMHEPRDPQELNGTHHLAFAGHLHGSQFVFWKRGNALYPGKFFYRWNVLKADSQSYFISKGLGDTLPIRYNCKRDMIFVEVIPKSKINQ